jgi:hypothetical protein
VFVDYVQLTYLMPPDNTKPRGYAQASKVAAAHVRAKRNPLLNVRKADSQEQAVAIAAAKRALRIDGAHVVKVYDEPTGRRVIMHWGGADLPLDLTDLCRRFRPYAGWTLSRLDVADNVPQLAKEQLHTGRAETMDHRYDLTGAQPSWTGCGIGKRGTDSSYCRIYDARKHTAGHAGKLARFGTFDFWRIEYELGRRYLRSKGIDTVDQLTPTLLGALWSSETHKKGAAVFGTTEYTNVQQRPAQEVEDELRDWNRAEMIEAMFRKMDPGRARALLDTLAR